MSLIDEKANATNEALVLSQQNLERITIRSNLTDEQMNKYEHWKIQPGMAQIKLEYIDFDHEIRLNVEHLNATDKKKLTDAAEEPKKKKFKVIEVTHAQTIRDNHLFPRDKIENI